ncbi:MAG: ROK family transcriptional regulator [bacterium]|jgi:glucokinase-like ROK family protein|nr:ROK family transcriptional regulator [bacterium]
MQKTDQPITDISYVSKINKTKIINLIRDKETISRSEIAKEIGLSLPTVSRLVDSLVQKEKLLIEVGTRTTERGRPPSLVTFAGKQNYVIGMSVGRNHISGILTNLNAEVLAEDKVPTNAASGYQSVVRRCASQVQKLIQDAGVSETNVLGVGVASGGLIDTRRSRIIFSATLNWREKDLAADLNGLINKPVKVDHDARVMALGEIQFGLGQNLRDFICVLLGYGIGASFIFEGKPYYGKSGMTGEFGHIVVSEKSQVQCSCGNRGCLEALASGRAIALQALKEMSNLKSPILEKLCDYDPLQLSAETVAIAASQGDEISRRILLDAAEHIGIGLATLVNLYNPEMIILGGGLVKAGDLLFDRIRAVVKERTLSRICQDVTIQPSLMGNRCRIMGAVALILNEILSLNIPAYANDSVAEDYI